MCQDILAVVRPVEASAGDVDYKAAAAAAAAAVRDALFAGQSCPYC